MTFEPAPKDLFDRWLDLAVYAPIGIALRVAEDLPRLSAAGRERAEGRVQLAKMVGQMAVAYGRTELDKRIAQQRSATAPSSTAPEPDHQPRAVEVAPPPFEGYDALPASEIVQRLNRSSAAERRRVVAYESANRARRTILAKAEQLGVT
jgi:hypothetical protein